jgi:hypothetical protein
VPRQTPARRGPPFRRRTGRVGRDGSGQVQNGGVVIEGHFVIQPSAGESTREQLGSAMFELRKTCRGSVGFRSG